MSLAWKLATAAAIMTAVPAPTAVRAKGPAGSPHTEALTLVLTCEADSIATLEPDHDAWWHDTRVRQWVVKRPFSPGDIGRPRAR